MTDKLRQAAQQMLEAVADLTILTPREWQAVHGLKIDALRTALAEQPAEQCWKCGDMDPAGHAKCNVPACGMREDTQPARREPLTWDELDVLWEKQRSKPFKSHGDDLMEFARAIERAHGIGEHE